jgi:hypothetical protein
MGVKAYPCVFLKNLNGSVVGFTYLRQGKKELFYKFHHFLSPSPFFSWYTPFHEAHNNKYATPGFLPPSSGIQGASSDRH